VSVVQLLDYAAVFVFALTGALTVALLCCAVSTFALRAGPLRFGWCLPVYRSRPPRA